MTAPAFFSKITTVGLARLAAAQLAEVPLVFAFVGVGDGLGSPITPDPSMTALRNERARVVVNQTSISDDAPDTFRIEGLLPVGTGGFYIREVGVFATDGALLVIASMPATYKSVPDDGVSESMYLRVLIEFAATDAIAITVDTSTVMATVEDVEDATAGKLWLWENFT